MVKNPPVSAGDGGLIPMLENPSREDPLEEEMAMQSRILAWEMPWTEGTWRPPFMGFQESDTT